MPDLQSLKIRRVTDGAQVFTLIADKNWSLKDLNRLFQKGMNVVVTDERSALVKGVNYDVEKTA